MKIATLLILVSSLTMAMLSTTYATDTAPSPTLDAVDSTANEDLLTIKRILDNKQKAAPVSCNEDIANNFYLECRALKNTNNHAKRVLCCPTASTRG